MFISSTCTYDVLPGFCSEDLRYVEDNADLLTVSEQQELNDTLTEISERQGVDVAVITANGYINARIITILIQFLV